MDKQKIEDVIKEIIADNLGIKTEEISQKTSFAEDLKLDSLGEVEMLMEFEEKFKLSISDEDAQKIQTVSDAVEYIGKHYNPN